MILVNRACIVVALIYIGCRCSNSISTGRSSLEVLEYVKSQDMCRLQENHRILWARSVGLKIEVFLLVLKSPVQSGFSPFLALTETETG